MALLVAAATPLAAQSLRAPVKPPAAAGGPPPTPAPGYTFRDAGGLTLEWAAGAEAVAGRVERLFPAAKAGVEEVLGRPLPKRPHVIVAPSDSEFVRRYARLTGEMPSASILAVALPGRDLIVVRASGVVEGSNAGLESTLRHELGHLVLGEVEARRAAFLPRWLNEGLCEVAAGRRLSDEEQTRLASWAKFGQLPDFSLYARGFPQHGEAGGRAYTISFAFVAWLAARGSARELVAALERQDLDGAFASLYSDRPEELELEWRVGLVAEQSSLKSLFYSLNVWSVAGLLAILAGLRAYAQRRKLSRQMAEEEARRAPRLAAAWERALARLAEGSGLVYCPECQAGTLGGDPLRCGACDMGPPEGTSAPG